MMCRRLAFCVLALVGVMALVSCSGDSGDETSAPTTTQASSGGETGGDGGEAAADTDWCTVLDKTEIEEQFGEGGTVSEGVPDDVVAGCEWEVGEDQSAPGTGAINVSHPVGASTGAPEERFAEYKASAIDAVDVQGVGDEAYYEPGFAAVTVRKGDTIFVVQASFIPEPEGIQAKVEALAAAAASRV